MLNVRISFKEKEGSKEILQFSAKVSSSKEAFKAFYQQYPEAIWIGCNATPIWGSDFPKIIS